MIIRSNKPTVGQRIDRVVSNLKSIITWDKTADWSWGNRPVYYNELPSDYYNEVGDLSQNSIIMACVQFIMRTFPEAPLVVKEEAANGDEIIKPHELTQLLRRPNAYYSGRLLWQATLCSFTLDSNAYWRKLRDGTDVVRELWYEPHHTIRPVRASVTEFISHYELYRRGRWLSEPEYRIAPSDIVHFRFGMDAGTGKGIPTLASALREVFTDQEAAAYTATVLRNVGVPPLVISPKGDTMLSQQEVDQLKAIVMQRTQGKHRGEPIVTPGNVEVEKLSFNPEEMNLRELRRIPEERITALLGIPAVVVGLGAGLDRSTYNNMAEAREQAYEGNLIPTKDQLADDITIQLLPEFENNQNRYAAFDYSNVRVLQGDVNAKSLRVATQFNAGYIDVNEARKADGYEPVEGADGLHKLPKNVAFVPLLATPVVPVVEPGPEEPDLTEMIPLKAFVKALTNGHTKEATEMVGAHK